MLRVFEIMAFKDVVGIFLNSDEKICDPQSTCYQKVPGFQICLKNMFSNSVSLDIMENYDKRVAVLIQQCL